MEINKLLRENIRELIPYSSARDDFKGKVSVFLDANENPFETGFYYDLNSEQPEAVKKKSLKGRVEWACLNRYPDPFQKKLKRKISKLKSVPQDNIFFGNGSDEIIDLLIRAFCEPGRDEIIILPPTYGMYRVVADIQNVNVREVRLTGDYQPDISGISKSVSSRSKLLFVCSPNNPTGNAVTYGIIEEILGIFPGIVIVDEAYIDFAKEKTVLPLVEKFHNLVVMHTLSKAWGLAGIRLGIGFADKKIIEILNRIKMPYNISELTQRIALKAIEQTKRKQSQLKTILREKEDLINDLNNLSQVDFVYQSDANFVLVKVRKAKLLYKFLIKNDIVVRDRSNMPGCEECLRITVGTPKENQKLIRTIKLFKI